VLINSNNMKCPICERKMERRRHEKIYPKLLEKHYYFTEWDYCDNCNWVQHYEKYKIKNI